MYTQDFIFHSIFRNLLFRCCFAGIFFAQFKRVPFHIEFFFNAVVVDVVFVVATGLVSTFLLKEHGIVDLMDSSTIVDI